MTGWFNDNQARCCGLVKWSPMRSLLSKQLHFTWRRHLIITRPGPDILLLFYIHIIEYVLYTPIVKSISIKVATWRRPLVTARQGTNGADNRFQLQMSQLEAAEPSVMQTNGQGRWAVAACEETSIQENLLNCADNTQASGPRALESKGPKGDHCQQ